MSSKQKKGEQKKKKKKKNKRQKKKRKKKKKKTFGLRETPIDKRQRMKFRLHEKKSSRTTPITSKGGEDYLQKGSHTKKRGA